MVGRPNDNIQLICAPLISSSLPIASSLNRFPNLFPSRSSSILLPNRSPGCMASCPILRYMFAVWPTSKSAWMVDMYTKCKRSNSELLLREQSSKTDSFSLKTNSFKRRSFFPHLVVNRIVKVRETRLTSITSHMLIGLSIFLLPKPLAFIPTSVLDGLFLYMAITALNGNQMFERITLLFMEQVSVFCPLLPDSLFRDSKVRKLFKFEI